METNSFELPDVTLEIYETVFRLSPAPGIIFKKDGTLFMVNDALIELYGSQMSDLLNRSSLEHLFHRRYRKRIIAHYQNRFPNQIKSLQVSFQCHNGAERIVHLKIRAIDESNFLLATLVDLTAYDVDTERIEGLTERRLSMSNEIIATMNSNFNTDQLIRIFFNQMNRIFAYDLACFVLCDIEGSELEVHVLKEVSEIDSWKCSGTHYSAFIHKLILLNPVDQNTETVKEICGILSLPVLGQYESRLLVQFKTDEQLIGAVLFFCRDKNVFTPHHIEIFQEISDQIALAFMKARLLQRYQQSLTNLSFLAQINESLCSSLNLDEVLKQVVESAQQMIHAKICTIHFLEEEHRICATGNTSNHIDIFDRFHPQIQQTILNQKPFIVEKIDYNNLQFFKNRAEFQKFGLRSLVVLPIITKGKTIALLSLFLDQIHDFDEYKLELLNMLANQAAIVIENAKLYNKMELSKNYLTSIIQSSAHIIVATDLEGNTTFFSDYACQLTGYSPEDVLDQPLFEQIFKNGRTLFAGLKQELFKGDKIRSFECRILTKRNQYVPVFWSFSWLINQHHEVIGIVGVGKAVAKSNKTNVEIAKKNYENCVDEIKT